MLRSVGRVFVLTMAAAAAFEQTSAQLPESLIELATERGDAGRILSFESTPETGGGASGYGSFRDVTPERQQYTFGVSPTAHFKAIVYLRGRQMVLVDEPAGSERRRRPITISAPALGTVELAGRIDGYRPEAMGGEIVVQYSAPWAHAFEGRVDGFVRTFDVARGPVDAQGRFTLRVPDFDKDPVHRSRAGGQDVGALLVALRGGRPVLLSVSPDRAARPELPIRAAYARDLVVYPLW